MTTTPVHYKEKAGVLKSTLTYFGLLGCAIFTSVVLLALAGLWVYHMVDVKFLGDASCSQAGGSHYLPKFTYCFYSDKWNEETYLAAISSIYTTIITVLIALQALISWVSFMVIRNSNKQEIEREVEKEIPYFFRTKDADKLLQDALQSISENAAKKAARELRDDEDKALETLQNLIYDELQPQFDGFRGKIEELQVKLRKLENGDTGDSDDQEEEIGGQEGEATDQDEPLHGGRLTE